MEVRRVSRCADPVLRPSVVFVWAAVAIAVTVGLTGSVIGCSFRTPPDRYPNVVLIDGMESDSFRRGIARHFGLDGDL